MFKWMSRMFMREIVQLDVRDTIRIAIKFLHLLLCSNVSVKFSIWVNESGWSPLNWIKYPMFIFYSRTPFCPLKAFGSLSSFLFCIVDFSSFELHTQSNPWHHLKGIVAEYQCDFVEMTILLKPIRNKLWYLIRMACAAFTHHCHF